MSYTTRILPPDEWPRLVGTEAESLWPHLNPINTRVVVVESDGAIVGAWVAMRVVHAECVWVDPAHRHRLGVVRRLLQGMRRIAMDWSVRQVVTAAATEQVRSLIHKLSGTKLPGESYVIPMPERG